MKRNPITMGNLSKQHALLLPQMLDAFEQSIMGNEFIGGASVHEFEREFASYVGSEYCVGVGNGTDALEIILRGLDLPEGSTVIVPANTFIATAEAVVNVGLRPIFVDVNDDYSIDFQHLTMLLDRFKTTGCIIAVHLYGIPQDLSQIAKLAASKGIDLLEDCAQAHGSKLNGKHVGLQGTAAAFSFFPGKNLGALGDAGAIITNSRSLSETFRRIANHGRLQKSDHEVIGRNSRLDSIQAKFLSIKLKKLDEWNSIRNRNAIIYREKLQDIADLVLPPTTNGFCSYHHFVIQVSERDLLMEYLNRRDIWPGVHYPQSVPDTSAFSGYKDSDCKSSRRLSQVIVSLPIGEHLEESEIEEVAAAISDFYDSRF